jgi:hypothetical protein
LHDEKKDFLVAKEAASMVMDIKTPAIIIPTTLPSINSGDKSGRHE